MIFHGPFRVSALLELSHPIEFNEFVQPVTLPSDCGNDLDSEYAVTIGNGHTLASDEDEFFRDMRLRQVDVQILPHRKCERIQPKSAIGSFICTIQKNEKSVYTGDSGN